MLLNGPNSSLLRKEKMNALEVWLNPPLDSRLDKKRNRHMDYRNCRTQLMYISYICIERNKDIVVVVNRNCIVFIQGKFRKNKIHLRQFTCYNFCFLAVQRSIVWSNFI